MSGIVGPAADCGDVEWAARLVVFPENCGGRRCLVFEEHVPAGDVVCVGIDVEPVLIAGRQADVFEGQVQDLVGSVVDGARFFEGEDDAGVLEFEGHEEPVGVVDPAAVGVRGKVGALVVGDGDIVGGAVDGAGVEAKYEVKACAVGCGPLDAVGVFDEVPVVPGGHDRLIVGLDIEGEFDSFDGWECRAAVGFKDFLGKFLSWSEVLWLWFWCWFWLGLGRGGFSVVVGCWFGRFRSWFAGRGEAENKGEEDGKDRRRVHGG